MTVAGLRVGIVGDFEPDRESHLATEAALQHAAAATSRRVEVRWLGTGNLETASESDLDCFDGFFFAPGSPYRSMAGALRAIRFARENDVPLLGTCGGFQHVVLEYARNVLGVTRADYAEEDLTGEGSWITPFACSLAGQRHRVELAASSRVRQIYGADTADEMYQCSFGLNPEHRPALERAGLRVAGTDVEGTARVVELPEALFFVATLFLPQLSSAAGRPHPLLCAFVIAAESKSSRRG
jgi:CTP synthase (UTP-ammonia lyase)